MKQDRYLCAALLASAMILAAPAGAATDFFSTSSGQGTPDGLCDVWQSVYDGWGLVAGDDADSDGRTNAQEEAAGTNPKDAADFIRIKEITAPTAAPLEFHFQGQRGKEYRLYSAASLAIPFSTETWTAEGAALVLTAADGMGSISCPRSGVRRFYVLTVGDHDSDGDGVTDWAEYRTGTDPANPTSATNASGGASGDFDTLHSLLSVTAQTITADATEKESTPARVRLTRSFGSMTLTVPFWSAGGADPVKGSATAGEYSWRDQANVPLPANQITLATGAATTDLLAVATLDALNEVPEVLVFKVGLPAPSQQAHGSRAEIRLCDAANTDANKRLFLAFLRPESGVETTASGIATLLLQGDNSQAETNVTFANLVSEQQNAYLNLANVPATPGLNVILPLGKGQLNAVPWPVVAAQSLSTDQAMLDSLFQGRIFLAVTTALFGEGEIKGTFAASSGSVSPPVHDDPGTPAVLVGTELRREVARFLTQATFGPTDAEITALANETATTYGGDRLAAFSAWIDRQMDPLQTPYLCYENYVRAADGEEFSQRNTSPRIFDFTDGNNQPYESNRRREWFAMATQSKAQLRQRAAFALSEIFVISEVDGGISSYQYGAADYWDMLARNANGSFRQLLEDVARHPMMGLYLSHLKNRAAYPSGGATIYPDENFAREIMQLFSIGLVHLHPDGSLKLGPDGLPLPTYDQTDITEMARVFTGLSYSMRAANVSVTANGTTATQRKGPPEANTSFTQSGGYRHYPETHINPMKMFGGGTSVSGTTYYYHDFGTKTLFHGQSGVQHVLAARSPTEANAEADLEEALDALASHPNAAPFLSRLLIQRLVTSNPSGGYVQRVVQAWNSSGGNLGVVLKAILLDYEAREISIADQPGAGKLREPVLRATQVLRAFNASSDVPLSGLTHYLDGFTLPADAQTSDYTLLPAADLAALTDGATRIRISNVDDTLTQTPLRAPTVFNWFLPDYTVSGPTAEAGLVLPEFQLSTETNVVNQTNFLYSPVFNSATPTEKYTGSPINGRGIDGSTYIGQGTSSPDTYRENIRLDFTAALGIYDNAYAAAVAGGQTASTATTTASAALVDWLDGFLTCGRLKARYGSTAGQPRQLIIDAVSATTDASSPANLKSIHRVRTAVYLVVNSAEHLVPK